VTTPVPSAPVGPLARALVEALESVAARDQVRSLIRGALLTSRLDVVPEDAATFRRFAHVALRANLERTLGAGTAEIVLEQLEHVVSTMSPKMVKLATGTGDETDEPSGERNVEGLPPFNGPGAGTPVGFNPSLAQTLVAKPRPRPELANLMRPEVPLEAPVLFPRSTSYESGTREKRALARVTRPSAAGLEEVNAPSSGPRALATDVIVVSLDPRVVTDIETRLRGRSRVRGVVTVAELVAAFGAVAGGRIAVVLDTGVPSIDIATFVSLAAMLPAGSHVVLWGTDERHKQRLVHMFPLVAGWVASGAAESPADILLAE
jgi:hypothetical protein